MRASISIIDRQRKHRTYPEATRRLTRRALLALGRQGWEVSITFVSPMLMRRLNRRFRGIDRPTDVLSFGEPEIAGGDERPRRAQQEEPSARTLGEIVIAPEVAHRNARLLNISGKRELQGLVLHGILHLCGYDHETDHGEMQRLEGKLRRCLLRTSL